MIIGNNFLAHMPLAILPLTPQYSCTFLHGEVNGLPMGLSGALYVQWWEHMMVICVCNEELGSDKFKSILAHGT